MVTDVGQTDRELPACRAARESSGGQPGQNNNNTRPGEGSDNNQGAATTSINHPSHSTTVCSVIHIFLGLMKLWRGHWVPSTMP